MIKRYLPLALLLLLPVILSAQNATDSDGRKQGPWVKKYSNGTVMYEGTFKDDKPVGLFKRYNTEGTLLSELTYNVSKDEAGAVFFYDDGLKAAEGKYVTRSKEGLWKFWSATQPHYLICEEYYHQDKRHGQSLKYYPDSTLAEKVTWNSGNRTGEWLQYYPDGSVALRTEYMDGMLEGPFSYYHPNGKLHYEGRYKNDVRNGDWMIFNEDGSLKKIIAYKEGIPSDPKQAESETMFLDELEKKKGKIEVRDVTGAIIQ